jgi:N-glycosylase/DNA lyase
MTKSARVVNDAIYALCGYLENTTGGRPTTFLVTEARLLLELTQCLLGSQVRHEVALAFADSLERHGLLYEMMAGKLGRGLSARLLSLLQTERKVVWPGGSIRTVRYRFPNRAALLVRTAKQLYGKGLSLEDLLARRRSAAHARDELVATCDGIGPKQASLFLRKVGLGDDLAILDTHILYYLRCYWDVEIQPHSLVRMNGYRAHEETFRSIANYFGHPVGIVDVAVWVTMRVLRGGQREHCESGIGWTGLDVGRSTNAGSRHKAISFVH